jgi:hypothetical protein
VFDKGYIPLSYILETPIPENLSRFNPISKLISSYMSSYVSKYSRFNRATGFLSRRGFIHLYSPIGEGSIILVKAEDALLVRMRYFRLKNPTVSDILSDNIISELIFQVYTNDMFKNPSVRKSYKVRSLFPYYSFDAIELSKEQAKTFILEGITS